MFLVILILSFQINYTLKSYVLREKIIYIFTADCAKKFSARRNLSNLRKKRSKSRGQIYLEPALYLQHQQFLVVN